jgi:hypothetical protein
LRGDDLHVGEFVAAFEHTFNSYMGHLDAKYQTNETAFFSFSFFSRYSVMGEDTWQLTPPRHEGKMKRGER